MYVGKKKLKKIMIPKADRDVEFSANDFWEEENKDSVNSHTQRLAESLSDDNLVYLYPIVWYAPSNMIFFNKFVENIVVAIVRRETEFEKAVTEIKVFVVKPMGEVVVLGNNNEELVKFLCKKPNLIVSKEGVLIFYNDNKIIATLDMDDWNSVTAKELSEVLNDETICGIRELTTDSNANIHLSFFGTGGINASPLHSEDYTLNANFSFIDSVGVTLEINPVVQKDSAEEKGQNDEENLSEPEAQSESSEQSEDETEDDEENLPKPEAKPDSAEQSEDETANKPKEDVPIIQTTLTTNYMGM